MEYIHTTSDTPDTLNQDKLEEITSVTLVTVYKLSTSHLEEILVQPSGKPLNIFVSGIVLRLAAACVIGVPLYVSRRRKWV